MSEAEEKQTAVIGRGESIITKKAPDVEAENSAELAKAEEAEIEGLKESAGWMCPKVKLNAWVSTNWSKRHLSLAFWNKCMRIPNFEI